MGLHGLAFGHTEAAAEIDSRGLWAEGWIARAGSAGETPPRPPQRLSPQMPCSRPDLLSADIQGHQRHKEGHLEQEDEEDCQGCIKGESLDRRHGCQGP